MTSQRSFGRGLETPDRRRILSDISNTPISHGFGKSGPGSAPQKRSLFDPDVPPRGRPAITPARRPDMFEVYEDCCDTANANVSAVQPTAFPPAPAPTTPAPPIMAFGSGAAVDATSRAARMQERWHDAAGADPDGFGTPAELAAMLEKGIQEAEIRDEALDMLHWRQARGLPTQDSQLPPSPPLSPQAMRWEGEDEELSPMKLSPLSLPDMHLDIDMEDLEI